MAFILSSFPATVAQWQHKHVFLSYGSASLKGFFNWSSNYGHSSQKNTLLTTHWPTDPSVRGSGMRRTEGQWPRQSESFLKSLQLKRLRPLSIPAEWVKDWEGEGEPWDPFHSPNYCWTQCSGIMLELNNAISVQSDFAMQTSMRAYPCWQLKKERKCYVRVMLFFLN